MVSRFARGAAGAVGATVAVGFVLGLVTNGSAAGGNDARALPDDLCARIGELGPLFPRPVALEQTGGGGGEVLCQATVEERLLPTHTQAKLRITVSRFTGYSGRPPADEARERFDSRRWQPVAGRPYPTKVRRAGHGEESWDVGAVVVRGDTVVLVEYSAFPVHRVTAERAVLVIADRAIWETR
jgi:hypothetical protein